MSDVKDKYRPSEAVSVVIPVFNRGSLISRTLDSIRSQSWSDIRIIAVDNNSTDDSAEVIRQWKKRNCGLQSNCSLTLLHQPEPGACAARNMGLRYVTTDKVLFFDSDDTMRPDLIRNAMLAFSKSPQADIVTWPMIIHYPDGKSHPTYLAKRNLFERHLINCILSTQQYMMRTRFARRVGGWNENLPAWNDWELGVRILLHYPQRAMLTTPQVDYFRRAESITGPDYSSGAGKWEASLYSAQNSIAKSDIKNKKRLLRLIAYRKAILAACYAKEHHPELGEELLKDAINSVSKWRRPIYNLLYHYTRLGGRGAYFLLSPFL